MYKKKHIKNLQHVQKILSDHKSEYSKLPFWNNFSTFCKENNQKKLCSNQKLVWTNASSQNQTNHIPGDIP